MCFSASASFVASGGLIALGGVSLKSASKKEKILAAVPFLFGIQQFFEGIQWLSLYSGSPSIPAAYGFLFFALIVWPIYVPALVLVLDKEKRKDVRWFLLLGIGVAAYFIWMLKTHAVFVSELNSCVGYNFGINVSWLAVAGYIIAVLVPLLISSKHMLRWFGIAVGISCAISLYFYTAVFTSVWCFFAALVSTVLVGYVRRKK